MPLRRAARHGCVSESEAPKPKRQGDSTYELASVRSAARHGLALRASWRQLKCVSETRELEAWLVLEAMLC